MDEKLRRMKRTATHTRMNGSCAYIAVGRQIERMEDKDGSRNKYTWGGKTLGRKRGCETKREGDEETARRARGWAGKGLGKTSEIYWEPGQTVETVWGNIMWGEGKEKWGGLLELEAIAEEKLVTIEIIIETAL